MDAAPSVSGHADYILGCDLNQAPCTPTTVLATDVNVAIDIQVVGATLYWLIQGQSGFDGRIHRYTLPGCSTVSDLVNGLSTPAEMLTDDGVYIVNSANIIQRCNGTACVGGIQDWVKGTAPHLRRSDTKFVYRADGNVVRRIAK